MIGEVAAESKWSLDELRARIKEMRATEVELTRLRTINEVMKRLEARGLLEAALVVGAMSVEGGESCGGR